MLVSACLFSARRGAGGAQGKGPPRRTSFRTASATTANRQAVAFTHGLQQARALFASRLAGTLGVRAPEGAEEGGSGQWASRHLVLDGVVLACWSSADACRRAQQQRHRRWVRPGIVARDGHFAEEAAAGAEEKEGEEKEERSSRGEGEARLLWTARVAGAEVHAVVGETAAPAPAPFDLVGGHGGGGRNSSHVFAVRFAPSVAGAVRSTSTSSSKSDQGAADQPVGAAAQLLTPPPNGTVYWFHAHDSRELKVWLRRLSQTARVYA